MILSNKKNYNINDIIWLQILIWKRIESKMHDDVLFIESPTCPKNKMRNESAICHKNKMRKTLPYIDLKITLKFI